MTRDFMTTGRLCRALRGSALAGAWTLILGTGIASAQVATAWTEFQGGPSKSGAASDGPQPGYRQAWRTAIAPGGPGGRFGLSAPVIAGDVAVAVGPEHVLGVEVSTGEQAFSVDRELGPPVAPAVATTSAGTLVVYTEGWGDGPADASPSTSASPATSPSSRCA